ncbi:MAG: cobalamin biosynthesis protein [Methanimicrococcus sp.]|nr:cobalamin biosynthesis protein [Methanimicrococcus sp.]
MVIELSELILNALINTFTFTSTELVLVLILAVLLDLIFGEPPAALHPVVWIGKLTGFLKERAPKNNRKLYGILMALTVIAFSVSVAFAVVFIAHLEFVPFFVGVSIQALFLKASFAIKCMVQPAGEIQKILDKDIETARQELVAYVSRDTSKLDRNQIVSAVTESISENYVDSLMSPMFFYVIFGPFGLPAAYLFKAVSTLDSMVGYKTEKYLRLGWFSAKFDDLLNWIPARLSPFFIMAGAAVSNLFKGRLEKFSPVEGLKLAFKENKATPSPNSGWPMAAAAGALRVRFEKPNTYVIGDGYRKPEPPDISRVSVLIIVTSVMTGIVSCLAISAVWYAVTFI